MCRPLLVVRAGVRHDLALAHRNVRGAEDAVAEVASVADPAPFLDTDIRCVCACVFLDTDIRCVCACRAFVSFGCPPVSCACGRAP